MLPYVQFFPLAMIMLVKTYLNSWERVQNVSVYVKIITAPPFLTSAQ
jgi:hypothetical protein